MLDILFKNGTIIDGSGKNCFTGDIGIKGKKIAVIGTVEEKAVQTIDITGLIICPGFIDNHSHSDYNVVIDPLGQNILSQGITTEIAGNCGHSLGPSKDGQWTMGHSMFPQATPEQIKLLEKKSRTFGSYFNLLEQTPMSTNLLSYVGQGAVRSAVMGFENRPASKKEMEEMGALVAEAMEAGAVGLSTGLSYPPGSFTTKEEIAKLCKIVASYGGNYVTHMRDESDDVLKSVEETIWIAKEAGLPAIISHHKVSGKKNWGLSAETLKLIDNAVAEGVDVYLDQYPYNAGCTRLISIIPQEFQNGGFEAVSENLKDKAFRHKVTERLEAMMAGEKGLAENLLISAGGFGGVRVVNWQSHPEFAGMGILDIAKALSCKDPYELLYDIIEETGASTMGLFTTVDENDIERIMSHPRTMGSCDTSHSTVVSINGHPRSFATFTRRITHYVRERHLIALEEMIRKSTSLTASVVGLKNKGLLAPGYDADIVVFDYENLEALADYAHPTARNKGMKFVLVNGKFALIDDVCTDILSGGVIRLNRQ